MNLISTVLGRSLTSETNNILLETYGEGVVQALEEHVINEEAPDALRKGCLKLQTMRNFATRFAYDVKKESEKNSSVEAILEKIETPLLMIRRFYDPFLENSVKLLKIDENLTSIVLSEEFPHGNFEIKNKCCHLKRHCFNNKFGVSYSYLEPRKYKEVYNNIEKCWERIAARCDAAVIKLKQKNPNIKLDDQEEITLNSYNESPFLKIISNHVDRLSIQFTTTPKQPLDDTLLKTMEGCVINEAEKAANALEEKSLKLQNMQSIAHQFAIEWKKQATGEGSFALRNYFGPLEDNENGKKRFYIPFVNNMCELSKIDETIAKEILSETFIINNRGEIDGKCFYDKFKIPYIKETAVILIPKIPEKKEDEAKIHNNIATYWEEFSRKCNSLLDCLQVRPIIEQIKQCIQIGDQKQPVLDVLTEDSV